jgi:hypothetical protein
MDEQDPLGAVTGGAYPPWVTYVAIVALLALGATVAVWEYLTSLYMLMAVAWLVVAGGLAATPLFRRVSAVDGLRLSLLVFGVALAWRYLMLMQDGVITNDVVSFASRGQAYLHGAVPYTDDFQVRKPPAYLLLAAGMGVTVGPSLVATRAIMSLVDSLVALTVMWIGEERFSRPFGLMAGLLYAINPISAVSVGVAGHYDPWVVMFALGGVWMMLRERRATAALLLGVGAALKLYPAVLVPWLLLSERNWSRRGLLLVLFAVPMAVSWVPMLLSNPDGLSFYLSYQASWSPNGGIAYGLVAAMGMDPLSDAAGLVTRVVEWAFYGLLVVMFLDWLRRRASAPDRHLLDWFRVVTLGFALLYVASLVGGVVEYGVDLGFGTTATAAVVGLTAVVMAGAGLWWVWTRWLPGDHGLGPDDRTIILAALSVNLLLLGSAQYNPWYILWLLPLVLLVRSWRLRDAWNALLVWRPEGRGVRLWPGNELTLGGGK